MSKMISTAGNFQYSVNIAYDLGNSEKLKGFIPTKSSLDLLEDILLSTQNQSTKRARILIGAYGKGKSHIILTILSVLQAHKPKSDFVHLNKKILENPKLQNLVQDYYESGKKLLPVLITGNGTSLSQSFLISLKNTLNENGLADFIPKTNYQAAIKAIIKWEKDYPDTLRQFEEVSGSKARDFISRLEDFNLETYRKFESLYPSLTAGSIFNPFLGFDVPLLYESVAKELRAQKLYDGLYVVYDEFSKYLESNIESASISDTKMLQDFAEKSCRSGVNQLHLLLISHKEIANYIDKLPKQKTDGWRGISERFEHILLNNNFSQVYEIISTVIHKEREAWQDFLREHCEEFFVLEENYKNHELFKEFKEDAVSLLVKQTFPLHPVSTFILPRLSERIAQNERTLFTFLSANTEATLPSFLEDYDDSKFSLVTPDLIFDYFEPLLKKEVYSGELHEIYHLTSVILEKLNGADNKPCELERKIVKTLSLIYILGQFERLKPVTEEIVRIYGYSYSKDAIESALKNLIEREFVIYLRQSNSYLKLKETSGLDIAKTIHDEIERGKKNFDLCDVLNSNNNERYFYPYRYNNEKEMTRFFEFRFVDYEKINDVLINPKQTATGQIRSDGKIIALICKNQEERDICTEKLLEFSKEKNQFIFCTLKGYENIEKSASELNAISELLKKTGSDEILSSEYQVVLEDVSEIVSAYIKKYTHPENGFCSYFYDGKEIKLNRRSELTEKLSDICDRVFSDSPIVNNEAINKNEITSMAHNSRRKILAGLLRNPLEKNLGLTGSGQDVAIMRSTLLHVGLLRQEESDSNNSDCATLNFDFGEDKYHLRPMFEAISDFVNEASGEKKSFMNLYEKLTSPEFGIGARKGIIPIYVASVFGQIKNQLVLYWDERQVPINADSLALLNEKPEDFSLLRFNLDENKKAYLAELKNIFSSKGESAEEIASAIHEWYLSLPKFSREARTPFASIIKAIKNEKGAQELLFTSIPDALSEGVCSLETARKIKIIKETYDGLLGNLSDELSFEVKEIFSQSSYSLWLSSLPESSLNHLFTDGTERLFAVLKKNSASDDDLIPDLAFAATGLRLEDWEESTKEKFLSQIKAWKKSAENFSLQSDSEKTTLGKNPNATKSYAVSFPKEDGKVMTKYFEKVDESPRARLLFNKVTDALDTMGQSLNQAEKRQVLMRVLETLCGGDD
ncbi:MAG: hypothetical protein IJ630_11105 [Treponema sp.]|nr:hypothetical protein [Treponema sp.]